MNIVDIFPEKFPDLHYTNKVVCCFGRLLEDIEEHADGPAALVLSLIRRCDMEAHQSSRELCIVCRDSMTDLHADNDQGMRISVCRQCLESAKENFIWVCMHCGSVYIRPKTMILQRLADPELRKAYLACRDLQMIQGIDLCIACDPEGIYEIAAAAACDREGGHC
jgi:hypothetical protein